jgi:hypothetical protein
MFSLHTKSIKVLVAATLTALVILPVAIAGAQAPTASRAPRANAAKQIKALQKQLTALKSQVAALAGRPAPVTLPPSGPAGGDLNGAFPNPKLRANAVTGATGAVETLSGDDIADNSLTSVKIRDGALTGSDFAPGAVGPAALASTQVVVGNGVPVAENQVKEAKVSCPAGTRLLSGGFEWKDNAKLGDTIIATGPDIGQNPNTDWEAVGRVVNGGDANEVRAVAL